MGNSANLKSLAGKEFTREDVDDPNKYNRKMFVGLDKPMLKLLDEVVAMVKDDDTCTMSFEHKDNRKPVTFIFKDGSSIYRISWPYYWRDFDNDILVTKDDKYDYRFKTLREMRGFFNIQGQINKIRFDMKTFILSNIHRSKL